MRVTHLSASSYDSFSHCNFKYYLNYILHVPDSSGASALLGSIYHKWSELLSIMKLVNHDPNSKYWNTDLLFKIVYDSMTQKDPVAASGIKKDKLKTIEKGMDWLLDSPYSPLKAETYGVEVPFNIVLNDKGFEIPKAFGSQEKGLILRGYIDRVDFVQGHPEILEIIDLKTGSRSDFDSKDRKKKGAEELKRMIQPRVYHLCMSRMFPQIKQFIVTFLFVCDGGPVSIIMTEEDLPETLEMIRRRLSTIKAMNEPIPNRSWKCKCLCSYEKTGECRSIENSIKEFGYKFVENQASIMNPPKKRR